MRHFAVSAIGRDRPGIVAGVARALLEHGVNVEDSQMGILRGHFAMVLVVSAPDEADAGGLRADLEHAAESLELEAIALSEVAPLDPAAATPDHIVTVYGADHPGILHAVAAALAEHAVNITGLSTRLVGEDERPLYVIIMEVVVGETSLAEVERALGVVRTEQQVEVTIRPLEQDAL